MAHLADRHAIIVTHRPFFRCHVAASSGTAPARSSDGGDVKRSDDLKREIELLRDRLARLSGASLRVSGSLDVNTVLRAVIDDARALTGARLGAIATVDEAGEVRDFVASGLAPDEHRRMMAWSDGPRLFAHLRDQPGSLRLRDLGAYAASLGFSSDLMQSKTFAGTPMRHGNVLVGNFFLAEKEGGGEFTGEDEEVLVLFASQAAAAVANALTYRNEHRARARLEALVETSPVGVAVFEARTGRPESLNREARRIVGGLSVEGRSLEQLLDVVVCRRADGQEIALSEYSLAQLIPSAEAVRAEEMTLEVPDGRGVTALVNATPIRAEDGTVESMVITLQDLAPLEEQERLRTEFLSLVSHELRAPLSSIKGSTTTVLGAAPHPEMPEMMQFFRIIDEQADHMRGLINELLDAGRIETGTLSISPAPVAVADLVEQARTAFQSARGRQTVRVDLPRDLPRVLADTRRIVQVLTNLFANAARHAPASSPIQVAAERDGAHVAITVADEGRGVPQDRLAHLFRKHTRVDRGRSGFGGTGLGLSICKGLVEAHGGRIRAESDGMGHGLRVTFTIPTADEADHDVASGGRATYALQQREGRAPPRILLVDDDPHALRYARDALAAAGYEALVSVDPQEVAQIITTQRPQLVLLDLVLGETDGIELLEHVPELADVPVIFISGYGGDETIARALDMGAADYIVKPFSPTELAARVRAALRRRAEPERVELGALVIDDAARQVTVNERPVELTATEYALLRALALNAGHVVTRETLLRQVWGGRTAGDPKLLRAFVKKLRRKLAADAAAPDCIVNVRGVGYRLTAPGEK